MNLFGKKILFAPNLEKAGADTLAKRLLKAVESAGGCGEILPNPSCEKSFEDAYACCVIGGDGTILSCVNAAIKYDVALIAINLGKLGFMSTLTETITDNDFVNILSGKGDVDSRLVLQTQINGKTFYALNEFTIKSSAQTVLNVSIKANGEFVARFTGDGLILSTPTGSTAYNMSAGGPLLFPSINALVLTTICPHTLSSRSIVFDSSTTIEADCDKSATLLCDGVACVQWNGKSPVKICSSTKRVNFLRVPNSSYFSILRTKLGWAENPRENKGSD